VRARAPRMAVAVEAWLSTQGSPAAEAVAPALACLPQVDSRLGAEQAQPRATVPPPRSMAEVEGAVLALCAREPFTHFASRLEAWAREAPAEVARAEWELAGQLAARELWLRAAEQELASLVEPASLLARAVREAGASPELSALAPQALRVLTARLPPEGLSHAREAEAWCAMAEAAALHPDTRSWVVHAASELRFSKEALPRALRLYEALLALAPEATLWARAFQAWSELHSEAHLAPQWLQEGLRQLVAAQPHALLAWLQRTERAEAAELIEAVAFTCRMELVEAWVEACWEGADEELKRLLSGAIVTLLDRTRDKKTARSIERQVLSARSLEEAARILLGGLPEDPEEWVALPAEGLRIWRRFAPRMLTYDAEFLKEAVRQAPSSAEAWEAAERYLAAHERDPAYIEVLRAMDARGWEELSQRALTRWVERRSGNVQALAEAAVAGERMGLPCEYLHPVLESLLEAVAGQSPPPSSPAVRQALALAHAHDVRPRKRRAARKKAAGASGARGARSKRKGGST
jgi:hypothetical protein